MYIVHTLSCNIHLIKFAAVLSYFVRCGSYNKATGALLADNTV